MRIPFALQTVFLQSQAGEDLEQIAPPTDGTAGKHYPPTLPKSRSSSSLRSSSSSNKEPPKKIGSRPATNRQTAMSLKIFNRLSKHVTTAADATKAKLWQKNNNYSGTAGGEMGHLNASEELWVPKTVQSSVSTSSSEGTSTSATPSGANKKEFTNPQEYLDHELAARGYSIKRFSSLQSAYHCPPNPLQLASFGNHLNTAVRQPDAQLLSDLMKVGVSPNACNKFGESIVHSVCRRGEAQKLQILLENSGSIQVSDDYGRTPLHDACWQSDNPDFDVVRILLAVDRDLIFLTDIRGSTPLTYVKKDNHACWMEFLKKELDHYWPKEDGVVANKKDRIPPLIMEQAGSRQLPSQITNLGLDVISLLATGQLSATEPRLLMAVRPAGIIPGRVEQPSVDKPSDAQDGSDRTERTSDEFSDDDSFDDDSDYDSDYDSDEDYDFDDGDLEDIIMIGNQRQ